MAHAHTKLLVHILFSTKGRRPVLKRENQERIFDYVGGTVRGLGGTPLGVGGIKDHIHILVELPLTLAISDFIGKLKSSSSKWIKGIHSGFGWQAGYTALSVSHSRLEPTRLYIQNQAEHHKTMDFREELLRLLKANTIAIDTDED